MNKLLAVKKYNLKLDISEKGFKDKFESNLTNKRSGIGKYLKGNVENKSFTIRTRNRLFDFNQDRQFSYFYELVGNFEQVNSKLNVNLKIRIKPLVQLYWLIGYILLALFIFPLTTPIEFFIIPFIILINYILMKVGILISEPFFIDSFRSLYGLKNDILKDLKLTVDYQDDIRIIKSKKSNRILKNIGLSFFIILFLIAISRDTELLQFMIFVPVTILIILSFHQFYQNYKFKQLSTSNEIVDFWLFYKMAKFPIPSFLFKFKKVNSIYLDDIRKRYNILTGFNYACLITSLIMTIIELGII